MTPEEDIRNMQLMITGGIVEEAITNGLPLEALRFPLASYRDRGTIDPNTGLFRREFIEQGQSEAKDALLNLKGHGFSKEEMLSIIRLATQRLKGEM